MLLQYQLHKTTYTSCDFLYISILAVEVHTESGRMDAGPSLDTIDQNATNDHSGL